MVEEEMASLSINPTDQVDALMEKEDGVTDQLITTHYFDTTFQEIPINFNVTKFGMDKSVMIWIGGDDVLLNNLAFSAATRYDRGLPSSAELFTAGGDRISGVMAAKLTKKLGKPVYVSMNIPESIDGGLLHCVEMRLMEEIQKDPSKF